MSSLVPLRENMLLNLRPGRSYSGYGRPGYALRLSSVRTTHDYLRFDRRYRIYEISDYGETIKTYKRTEQDEIVDQMDLVGKNAPSPYEGS